MASAFPAPLNSATAMLTCWSTMFEAMAPKAMTSEMICRWRDDRSSRMASPPLTPSSSPVFDASERARRLLTAHDRHHDAETGDHHPGAHEDHRARSDRLHEERGQAGAGGAAEAGAAADEAEDALGLARIVDVVGQRPELADQQDRQDLHHHEEGHRHPVGADEREQEPEQQQQRRDAHLGDRDHPAPGHHRDGLDVALHDEADGHADAERDPRQVVGAQLGNVFGPGDRLDDVVARHRQERVQEHQQRGGGLAVAELHDRAQQARGEGRTFGHEEVSRILYRREPRQAQ